MVVKLSISVPDDVAQILAEQENTSAYITEAVRMRHNRETFTDVIAGYGYQITEQGRARARAALTAARAAAAKAAAA